MRALVRIFVLALVLSGTLLGSAAAKPHKPVALHPKWHRISRSLNVDVLTTGRYVYIGGAMGSGSLIDELTGKRVVVTIPAGCFLAEQDNLGGNAAPLAGSWLVATCNVGHPAAPYELYNIPAGTWTPFTPNSAAFNAQCLSVDCGWGYVAIGNDWIEFDSAGCFHCYSPPSFAFQNLQAGQVEGVPPDWKPGGTETPDLNSPTLTRVLCPP